MSPEYGFLCQERHFGAAAKNYLRGSPYIKAGGAPAAN